MSICSIINVYKFSWNQYRHDSVPFNVPMQRLQIVWQLLLDFLTSVWQPLEVSVHSATAVTTHKCLSAGIILVSNIHSNHHATASNFERIESTYKIHDSTKEWTSTSEVCCVRQKMLSLYCTWTPNRTCSPGQSHDFVGKTFSFPLTHFVSSTRPWSIMVEP